MNKNLDLLILLHELKFSYICFGGQRLELMGLQRIDELHKLISYCESQKLKFRKEENKALTIYLEK